MFRCRRVLSKDKKEPPSRGRQGVADHESCRTSETGGPYRVEVGLESNGLGAVRNGTCFRRALLVPLASEGHAGGECGNCDEADTQCANGDLLRLQGRWTGNDLQVVSADSVPSLA